MSLQPTILTRESFAQSLKKDRLEGLNPMSMKKTSFLFLLALMLSGPISADTQIEVEPFLALSYTNGFKKGTDTRLDLAYTVEGETVKGSIVVRQSPGKTTNRFGKQWLGVYSTGRVTVNKEKIETRGLDLFEKETLYQSHSIDLDDETVSTYKWETLPTSLQLGNQVEIGSVAERGKEGNLLSSGTVAWLLNRNSTGYEFCTIEKTVAAETKVTTETHECDVFDAKKRLIGVTFEMKSSDQTSVKGKGTIKIK